MREHFLAVAALAAATPAVALAVADPASRAAPLPTVSAKLTGAAEVEQGSPTGSGTAVITMDTTTGNVCWNLTVSGIDKPLSSHIHKAPAGKSGPVVVPLGPTFSTKGCVIAQRSVVRAILASPASYYVNVHTKKYLNGAILGRLHRRS